MEWFIDSGCTLSLISLEVYRRILVDKRPVLEVNDFEMRTADGSLLPDHGKVQLNVTIEKRSFRHPFIAVNLTNRLFADAQWPD